MADSRRATNFVQRATDHPAAGAYLSLPVFFLGVIGNNGSATADVKLPAGMKGKVTAISARARAVTSDPLLTVGSNATPTKYANIATFTTNLGDVSLASANKETSAGEVIRVKILNDAGDSITDATVVVHLFVTAHPTAAP